jgi:hypothetical protein
MPAAADFFMGRQVVFLKQPIDLTATCRLNIAHRGRGGMSKKKAGKKGERRRLETRRLEMERQRERRERNQRREAEHRTKQQEQRPQQQQNQQEMRWPDSSVTDWDQPMPPKKI